MPTSSPSSTPRNALSLVLGVAVGLVVAEVAFGIRDQWAFPHINTYLPDDTLGVRLKPSSTQRIRFGGNPVSAYHLNSRGYRGPEGLESTENGVLIVGDSQAFGLGVNDDETSAHQLATLTGRAVLNGGVPTYGPEEYLLVAEEILSSTQNVSDLVVVFNLGNDLFEMERPNTQRHAVMDGWAIRSENAPAQITDFPFRQTLMSNSHLVFGVRSLLFQQGEQPLDGLPSEGRAEDLLVAATSSEAIAQVELNAAPNRGPAPAHQATPTPELGETDEESESLEQIIQQGSPEAREETLNAELRDQISIGAVVNRAHVGDIVYVAYGESSRPIHITAEMLERGAKLRRRQRIAEARDGDALTRQGPEPLRLRGSLEPLAPLPPRTISPIHRFASKAKALASHHGAELTVVILPLDVHILPSQFNKYGVEPFDVSQTLLLIKELENDLMNQGIRTVNPSEALAANGDASWLDKDLHLSPLGQSILAQELAKGLSKEVISRAGATYPDGRGRLPTEAEFVQSGEITVKGSSKNRCGTYIVREWFYAECLSIPRDSVLGVSFIDAPLESQAVVDPHGLRLWIPLLERPASVDVHWERRSERLSIDWSNTPPTLRFATVAHPTTVPEGTRISRDFGSWIFGDYATQCASSSDPDGCLSGSRHHLPDCPQGEDWAGSQWLCTPLCSSDVPCEEGLCTPWSEGAVCL